MSKTKLTVADHVRMMELFASKTDDLTIRIKVRCLRTLAEPYLNDPDPKRVRIDELLATINQKWEVYRELRAFFRDAQAAVHAELYAALCPDPTYLDLVQD